MQDEIIYIGGISNIADSESERDSLVIRARLTSTRHVSGDVLDDDDDDDGGDVGGGGDNHDDDDDGDGGGGDNHDDDDGGGCNHLWGLLNLNLQSPSGSSDNSATR